MHAMLQKRIPWLRGKFEDLLETLQMLHSQDVSSLGELHIPDSVLAEAATTSQQPSMHAAMRPPAPPPLQAVAALQPAPAAPPAMPLPEAPSLATTMPYSAVQSLSAMQTAGSSANLTRAPKLAQPLPWAHRHPVMDDASHVYGGATQHDPTPPGRVRYATDAGEVSSASAPGPSVAQGSWIFAQEGEGEAEHGGESATHSHLHTPAADAANIAIQPLPATQPNSAAATQPYSAAAKENSQVLAQVRREGAKVLQEALDLKRRIRGRDDGDDEVDSTCHP
jgi:hypothetical protein